MTQILSYGGGIQTVAMCVLVATERLPRPDAVIAADTGREMPTTWEYADTYMRPLLARVGLDLHIASHDLATVDLYAHNGDLLIPVYTSTGKLPTFCSTEWKARVVQRHARSLGYTDELVMWIGFSQEERKRIKRVEPNRRYPLLDLMMTRADCERVILDAGLPLPHKSRCFMCPHQHNSEWREVQAIPELWEQAKALDYEVREADERGTIYLHRARKPLDQIDLTPDSRDEGERQCGLGLCFV